MLKLSDVFGDWQVEISAPSTAATIGKTEKILLGRLEISEREFRFHAKNEKAIPDFRPVISFLRRTNGGVVISKRGETSWSLRFETNVKGGADTGVYYVTHDKKQNRLKLSPDFHVQPFVNGPPDIWKTLGDNVRK